MCIRDSVDIELARQHGESIALIVADQDRGGTESIYGGDGEMCIRDSTNVEYYAYQNVTTTNTYLTTQSYTISGTAAAAPATPAPASWLLLLTGLAVAGLLSWLRRLRVPEA